MRGFDESWVTSAQTDDEALQAWILLASIRKTFTPRKISIILSEGVSQPMEFVLGKVFDLVIRERHHEEAKSNEVGNLYEYLKSCCWKLNLWKKCVYISPNSLVLENCDKLFDKNELSALELPCGRFSSSLFVCKPNPKTYEKIVIAQLEMPREDEDTILNMVFNDWQKSGKQHILDQSFNVPVEGDTGCGNPKIVKFLEHFWVDRGEGTNGVSQAKCFTIFHNDVLPKINELEIGPIKSYLTNFLESKNFSTAPTPKNGFRNSGDERALANSIAVIGMSCRFPEANDLEEYWKLLAQGIDAVKPRPDVRKDLVGPTPDNVKFEGGFLKCAIDEFDAAFFGISPRKAVYVDPQQRLLLEVAWEALENAGINPVSLKGTDTGVFVGIWQHDYDYLIPRNEVLTSEEFYHKYLGNLPSASAGRLSYFLGTNGLSIAMEAGCASSMGALHLACESLRNGNISLAIASGVNLTLQAAYKQFAKEEATIILSPDFRCKTFDNNANGFVRSEGCGSVILKRYADAVKDGENILALIRGSAMNSDGASTSFGTPNPLSQEMVYREALLNANILASEITYVEAHGTGTPVGDPTEFYSLSKVYSEGRKEPLYVASVKTNIGHTESAAGIAALIKVILAIRHQAIPPHLHLENINESIDLNKIPAIIPQNLTKWTFPRKAAISSFSMTGMNVHAIVEETPSLESVMNVCSGLKQLVPISAKSLDSLKVIAEKYVNYLEKHREIGLEDFAFATSACRAHFRHRIAAIANNVPSLIEALKNQDYVSSKVGSVDNKIGFLFTGQGSQYLGMGRDLYHHCEAFRRAFEKCDKIFQSYLEKSLIDIMWTDSNLLNRTIYSQPAIFCIQYCLVELWKQFGINPDYVLGHSVGEFCATVCAGILTLEDGMKLVIERSRLVQKLEEGRMLVLKTSSRNAESLIKLFDGKGTDSWVDIAAINSDDEVVVSTSIQTIDELVALSENHNIRSQKLLSSHAFHSRAMDVILGEFENIATTVIHREPTCAYISGTLAKQMDYHEFRAGYWREHLRSAVQFSEASKLLWSKNCRVLMEIGAQPVLLALTMSNVENSHTGLFCPSLRKADQDWDSILNTLSKLYLRGIEINWSMWYGQRQKSLVLPTYAFQRQKYWYYDESKNEQGYPMGIGGKVIHPILGHVIPSPLQDQLYVQHISVKNFPYLDDHKVGALHVFPGAAYLEASLAAGKELLGGNMSFPIYIQNLNIDAALTLDKPVRLHTVVKCTKIDSEITYQISFHKATAPGQLDTWRRHARSTLVPGMKSTSFVGLDLDVLRARLPFHDRKAIIQLYGKLDMTGIKLGPLFQTVMCAWASSTELVAELELPSDNSEYICHPVIIDAMFQAQPLLEFLPKREINLELMHLPVSARKFLWLANPFTQKLYIHTTKPCAESEVSVSLFNANGERLAVLEGYETIESTLDSFMRSLRAESVPVPTFYEERWTHMAGVAESRATFGPNTTWDISETTLNKLEYLNTYGIEMKDSLNLVNSMCFYSIIIAIQECGWPWPNIDEILKPEFWKAYLPPQLEGTKYYIALTEAMKEEGFVNFETNAVKISALPSIPHCQKMVEHIQERILLLEHDGALFKFACHTCENLVGILRGATSALSVLFPIDPNVYGAKKFYGESAVRTLPYDLLATSFSDMLSKQMTGRNGIFRILEVGGGTGAATKKMVAKLREIGVTFQYTFTDISHLFLQDASVTFGEENFTFQILDIEDDPLAQGFCPGYFDAVLAVEVLHATKCIESSLAHIGILLRENGVLILGEAYATPHVMKTSFCLLDGWWRFADRRTASPIMSQESWVNTLHKAGFGEVKKVSSNYPDLVGTLIAKRINLNMLHIGATPSKNTWLLFGDPKSKLLEEIHKRLILANRCASVVTSRNAEPCQEVQQIDENTVRINYSDPSHFAHVFKASVRGGLEGSIYFSTDLNYNQNDIAAELEHRCGGLLHWFQAISGSYQSAKVKPKLVVLTRGVNYMGDQQEGNPENGTIWGAFRSIMNELLDFQATIIDLDQNVMDGLDEEGTVDEISKYLWTTKEEKFVMLREGKHFVQRLAQMENPPPPLTLPNSDRFEFLKPESGAFVDIQIGPTSQPDIAPDEVEVQVRAVALNFRDILVVLKPEGFEKHMVSMEVGCDISGVVSSVGSSVSRFAVGDEVFGFTNNGGIKSYATVPAQFLLPKPI